MVMVLLFVVVDVGLLFLFVGRRINIGLVDVPFFFYLLFFVDPKFLD